MSRTGQRSTLREGGDELPLSLLPRFNLRVLNLRLRYVRRVPNVLRLRGRQMSDELLQEIQQAQVEAAEGVVVENLRRKGLLSPPESATPTNLRQFPARVGIVINYDQWRILMREFVDKVAGADDDLKVQMEWTLETFLRWVANKQKETTK